MMKNFPYFLAILLIASCTTKRKASIKIQANVPIQINNQHLKKDDKGAYNYIVDLDSPEILTLKESNNEWEIYLEPQKNLEITINKNDLVFDGDLIAENKHLLKEKKQSDAIASYLNKNWYLLHKNNLTVFQSKIDSLKTIFNTGMDTNKLLSIQFKTLNKASVDFAFDRLLLRYPRFHKNFTGKEVRISKNILNGFKNTLDTPAYAHLTSYKKFTKTYLDQKIQEQFLANNDHSSYKGLIKTNTALAIIQKTFTNKELQEFWSLEYIKDHIKNYTWINGKTLLEKLKKHSTSPKIKKNIIAYEKSIFEKRKNIETFVYKTINNFKLEAYIYKPKNFNPNKKYAALAAFHGGGWIVGDAAFTISSAKHAAKNGLIGFSVEYRLSNKEDVSPEEATQDTRDFIKWLRKNADSLSINPQQIIAKGVSAGGHLVASTAVMQQEKNSVPNAVILVSPALDTSDRYFKSLLRKDQNAHELSPLENLQKDTKVPPTLILQGKTDNLTPTKYAEAFKNKMDAFNYTCNLVVYENCGHLFTPSHLDDTGWPQTDPAISKKAYQKQAEFYKELGYTK